MGRGWIARLAFGLASAPGVAGAAIAAGAELSGRWLGQDGHDVVGRTHLAGPSGVQDLRLAIVGLPPGARVVGLTVQGEGGGRWALDARPGSWLAKVDRAAGATEAHISIEPYQVESGRSFEVTVAYDDGRSATVSIRGGKADPDLRATAAALGATLIGQDPGGRDLAGPGPNVGPDGRADTRIALVRLAVGSEVRSVRIVGPDGLVWESGPNTRATTGAEFVRDPGDRSRGVVHLQSPRDLTGSRLTIRVEYADDRSDSFVLVGGRVDPALASTGGSPPKVDPIALRATWGGPSASGDVVVRLEGLPESRPVVGVHLGDGIVGAWSEHTGGGMFDALPLKLSRGPDPTRAVLAFPPVRDESGAIMTLRFVHDDGHSSIATFPGGPADPSLPVGPISGTTARARPGDDIAALAARHGTVILGSGEYPLFEPLRLDRPVTLTSEGGATLRFDQAKGEPPWTAAIKLRSGGITLDRLAIRFAGPVRWDQAVGYGPAVIGTTDDRDPKPEGPPRPPLVGLRFARLDVEGPPPASTSPTAWEEAPRLLRLVGASAGVIEGNRFRGGMIEAWDGPWRIAANRHDGPVARTFAHAILAIHDPHDVEILDNRVHQFDPAGKAWRWLVLTNRGANLRVANNRVEGVGPRDDDRIPHPNAPETVLTESYRIRFEGKPSATSADGLTLTVGELPGGPARVGDVVAILSGPRAGEWRRVALPIGPGSVRLDRPVALDGGAVSIVPGFVDTRFEGNTIDDRGSAVASPFVLAGGHFGTRLVGNTTKGGGVPVRAVATASEQPFHWGWSHDPMFGLVVEGNTFDGACSGLLLAIERGTNVRASRGRVYFKAGLRDNVFSPTSLPAVLIGDGNPGDPSALVVDESGNRRGAESPTTPDLIRARGATVNGRAHEGEVDLHPSRR